MTKEQINAIRENLKNITDEQIEKIAEIIAPVIAPDPDQKISNTWKMWCDIKGEVYTGENKFAEKHGSNNAKCFYAGWKACENYLKNKNAS